ncbi:MAG: hypothetical protein AAFW73_25515 [Bacteroidota bacterium]
MRFLFILSGLMLSCNIQFFSGPEFKTGGFEAFANEMSKYAPQRADFFPADYGWKDGDLLLIITNAEFNGQVKMPTPEELQPILSQLSQHLKDIRTYQRVVIGYELIKNDTLEYQPFIFNTSDLLPVD